MCTGMCVQICAQSVQICVCTLPVLLSVYELYMCTNMCTYFLTLLCSNKCTNRCTSFLIFYVYKYVYIYLYTYFFLFYLYRYGFRYLYKLVHILYVQIWVQISVHTSSYFMCAIMCIKFFIFYVQISVQCTYFLVSYVCKYTCTQFSVHYVYTDICTYFLVSYVCKYTCTQFSVHYEYGYLYILPRIVGPVDLPSRTSPPLASQLWRTTPSLSFPAHLRSTINVHIYNHESIHNIRVDQACGFVDACRLAIGGSQVKIWSTSTLLLLSARRFKLVNLLNWRFYICRTFSCERFK